MGGTARCGGGNCTAFRAPRGKRFAPAPGSGGVAAAARGRVLRRTLEGQEPFAALLRARGTRGSLEHRFAARVPGTRRVSRFGCRERRRPARRAWPDDRVRGACTG